MSSRLIGPRTFGELSDREQLLWKRFFARRGIDWTDVTEFEIDLETPVPTVVVRFVDESASARFPIEDERRIRARLLERPLLRRSSLRGEPML